VKIAIFSLTKLVYPFAVWGVQMHVYNLAKHLQKKGHKVTIFCAKHSIYEGGFYSIDQSIEEHTVDNIDIKIACSYRGLEKLLRECNKGFDILHIHAYRSIPINPKTLKQIVIPVVFTPHAIFPPTSKLNKNLQMFYDHFFGKPLLECSDAVIALNEKNVNELVAIGADIRKIRIIPNAITCEDFDNPPSQEQFREMYNVRGDYALFNGRLVEHKGVHTLLASIKEIRSATTLSLIIIGRGNGGYVNQLMNYIRANGLDQRVSLFETLDRETQLSAYNGAKIFILPSYHEGLPTVLLEAMGMGKVCIASEAAGQGIIVDGINGFSFSTGDPQDLSTVITKVLKTDPDVLRDVGLNARKTIKDNYDWTTNVNELEKVYRTLVTRNNI
jgi:glycosyltransferase involved in cell wall biosynthesis